MFIIRSEKVKVQLRRRKKQQVSKKVVFQLAKDIVCVCNQIKTTTTKSIVLSLKKHFRLKRQQKNFTAHFSQFSTYTNFRKCNGGENWAGGSWCHKTFGDSKKWWSSDCHCVRVREIIIWPVEIISKCWQPSFKQWLWSFPFQIKQLQSSPFTHSLFKSKILKAEKYFDFDVIRQME